MSIGIIQKERAYDCVNEGKREKSLPQTLPSIDRCRGPEREPRDPASISWKGGGGGEDSPSSSLSAFLLLLCRKHVLLSTKGYVPRPLPPSHDASGRGATESSWVDRGPKPSKPRPLFRKKSRDKISFFSRKTNAEIISVLKQFEMFFLSLHSRHFNPKTFLTTRKGTPKLFSSPPESHRKKPSHRLLSWINFYGIAGK